MITYIVRFIKRLLVLLPGMGIAFVAYQDILPFFDRGLPFLVALFATYLAAAYILIPLGVRLVQSFLPSSHVPLYSTTPDGFASDPVNIGIVGTVEQLTDAMKKAGWHEADPKTPATLIRLLWSTLTRRAYKNAPFSTLYLLGRGQDFGFQLPLKNDPRHRHHVRFWAASHTGNPRHLDHISFWEHLHKSDLVNKRILWVGAVSRDAGLGVIRHNAQITHMIDPDTDAERELLTSQLKRTGLVRRTRSVKIGEPYKLTNRVLTGFLHTDGHMKILEL